MAETGEIYMTDSLADEPREEYHNEFPLMKVGDTFQVGGPVASSYKVKQVHKNEKTGRMIMFAETY